MRIIGRAPRLSTLVAIASLGAAIGSLGAATALLDVLVMHPVRVDSPDRVVHVGGAASNIPGYQADDWWAQASALSAFAHYQAGNAPVEAGTTRRHVAVSVVSKGFFEVMRHVPAAGRLLARSDGETTGVRAAVVSGAFATAAFGSAPRAVGSTVTIAGVPHVIVGVVGRGAEFPRLTDVWAVRSDALDTDSIPATGNRPTWSGMSGAGLGRLADGASVETAGAQMTALLARLSAEMASRTSLRFGDLVRVRPLRDVLANGPTIAVTSFLLASLLGLVLAALNCGLLVMNEQAARQREWAMRQALGATPAAVRASIARQSASWALVAAAAGIGGMYGLLGLVESLASSSGYFVPAMTGMARVYWLVGGLAIVSTAALVAVLPAVASTRVPLAPVLNDRRPYAVPTAPSWVVRGIVVGVQACAGFVMLVGAVYATRDLVRSLGFDTGQQPMTHAQVLPLRAGRTEGPEDRVARWDAVWAAASTVPGIDQLAMISEVPARAAGNGVFMEANGKHTFVARRFVRGRFDRLLGIDVVAGAPPDSAGGLALSRSASRALAGGQAMPGLVRFDGLARPWRVVAVLADLRFQDTATPDEPAVFVSVTQAAEFNLSVPSMHLLFSCAGVCGADVVGRVVEAVAPHADADSPAVDLASIYAAAARPARVRALVANVYAVIALLIVVAGVYTLSGAVVLGSAFESGMRLALGAQRAAVVVRLVARVCTPASLGLAAGAVLTMTASARWVPASVAQPTAVDLSGAATLLLGTSAVAALLPAVFLVRQPLLALLRRDG